MGDFKVVDEDGEWIVSKALYTMVHAERRLKFEPKLPTKVKLDDWLNGQMGHGVFAKCPDPMAPAEKAPSGPGPKAK